MRMTFSEIGFLCHCVFFLQEGDKKPGMEPKETRTDVMESIPQEPPNLDHFTSVDGAHRENRSGELVTMDFLSMLNI